MRVFVVTVNTETVFTLHPQAEKLLDKIRQQVAKSIKENYGQRDVITNAWNETMSLVKHFAVLFRTRVFALHG